jgi:hypothetical protein
MKLFVPISITVLAAALLTGCGDSASAPQTQTTPPASDYAGTLLNAKKTADKVIDTTALTKAVQLFYVQEGRYPKTLTELAPSYIPKIPEAPLGYKISYDAAKGEVKVVKE